GAAHRAELRGAFDEGDRGGGGALALDLDVDVRVDGAEALGPEGHEVVERVGADGVEVAGDAGDGLVGLEGGIDLDLAEGRGDAEGAGREGGEEGFFHGALFMLYAGESEGGAGRSERR